MRYHFFVAIVFSIIAGRGAVIEAAEPAKTDSIAADKLGAQEKLLAALNGPARNIEFFEAPLTEVINRIKEDHAIQIVLDERALMNAAIGTDTLITKNLKELKLAEALQLMLRDHGLAWVLRDDVVQVTTAAEAAKILTRRAYPVRDLVPHDAQSANDFQELMQVIRETVEPESWRGAAQDPAPKLGNEETRPPRGAMVASTASASIVVLHERRVHDEIDALLAALRVARKRQSIESPAPVPGAVAPPHRPATNAH